MNNIKICKYYKHPKTCTNQNSCAQRLISHPQFCCSELYYSMGLEEVIEKYEQALDEIEENIKAINNECFYNDFCDCKTCDMKNGCSYYRKSIVLDIINKTKENK